VNQLHPMVEKARENMAVIAPEASQTIEVVLADAGYISEKNLFGEPHIETADGTYVDDGAGPCAVQEAWLNGGACVGSDQGGSWDSAFYAQRACGLCPGMGIDLYNTQSPEVVAKRKGDFISGGLVEISGRGRGIRILSKPTIRSLFLNRDMPIPQWRMLLASLTARFNPFPQRFEQQAL